jgi:DNA-binding MarR family transcriptional regulator
MKPVEKATGSDNDRTARVLLEVMRLLMNRIAGHYRQQHQPVLPQHVGMLAKISEGPCRLSDLARHLCVQLPTISRSVNLLVERGFVERWIPESNRRTTMVRLTPEGRKVLDSVTADAVAQTGALLGSLSADEHKTVHSAVELLAGAFRQPGDPQAAGDAGGDSGNKSGGRSADGALDEGPAGAQSNS